MDPWKELEIARGASPEQIRRAYLRLARKTHPDCNDDPAAHKRFLRVRAAYESLRNGRDTHHAQGPSPHTVPVSPAEVIAAARAMFHREFQKHGLRHANREPGFGQLGMRIVMYVR